jgi:hypothetical protein
MLHKLNETFVAGMEGTVAEDIFAEGAKRHPKGIPVFSIDGFSS